MSKIWWFLQNTSANLLEFFFLHNLHVFVYDSLSLYIAPQEEKLLTCDIWTPQVHCLVVCVFYEEQSEISTGLRIHPQKTEQMPVIQKTGNKGFCAHKYSLISGISINLTKWQHTNTNTVINLAKKEHVTWEVIVLVYCFYCNLFMTRIANVLLAFYKLKSSSQKQVFNNPDTITFTICLFRRKERLYVQCAKAYPTQLPTQWYSSAPLHPLLHFSGEATSWCTSCCLVLSSNHISPWS